MKALTGGMTNAVFRCSKPSGDNSTVLLRSYGEGTEMFFSRENELKVAKVLGELGFGPALLATLEDGRVEEFLEGKALDAEDMHRPLISDLVAREWGRVGGGVGWGGVGWGPVGRVRAAARNVVVKVEAAARDVVGFGLWSPPLASPLWPIVDRRQMAKLHALDMDTGDRDPLIFRTLEDFHGKAMDVCGDFFGGVDVVELGKMVAELRERLEEGVPSKTVFCHNDLQSGNIMYKGKSSAAASTGDAARKTAGANGDTPAPFPSQTSGRPVSLIDYEYSGYNPRGFDVGNHFCEWMADYAAEESHKLDLERYPSMEERRRYCRAYLGTINGVPDTEVSAEEVDGLVTEADAYSLASHLLWASWSLLQSKSETAAAGFDYIKYAGERIRAYRHFSELLLPSPAK
eukprot:jgi/Undpi1/9674/HiC_scaffold_27.g12130.m1